MTQEEFIKVLGEKGYSYEIEGDRIIVTGGNSDGYVSLKWLSSIPSGVEFRNKGTVDLESVKEIPADTIFNNYHEHQNGVYLQSIKRIPPGLKFNQFSDIYLDSLEGIDPWVEFSNYSGDVFSNIFGNKWFTSLDISKISNEQDSINSIKLLNIMIKREIFNL